MLGLNRLRWGLRFTDSSMSTMADSGEQRAARMVAAPAMIRQMGERVEQQLEPLQCPRCDSTNTKFCYYNNYNLAQPRHFCKSCRRYWTKGGALRNIPVGGGSRKPGVKRPRAATSPVPTTSSGVVSPMQVVGSAGDHHFGYVPLLPASSAGYGGYLALGSQPLLARQPASLEEMICFGASFNGKSMFPVAPMPELFNSGVGACQFSDPADCFPWPELAISAVPGKGLRP